MDKQISESFKDYQYINVETFRKNGKGVKTPVWFVNDANTLAVRTESSSGKMKRIVEAADGYIQNKNWEGETRFDVITVIFFGQNFELEHFKDAFYPTL